MSFKKLKPHRWAKISACGGGALLVSLVLFYFMSVLISNTDDLKKQGDTEGLIEFTRIKPRSFLDEKKRVLPKKKPKLKKTPRMQKISSALPPVNKLPPQNHLPNIRSILKAGGPAVGSFGGTVFGGSAVPLVRIDPVYPPQAAMRGIEGYVILQFNITPTGRASQIKILDSRPPRIFNREAVRALRKWKYRPKIEDGKAVTQHNQVTNITFTLE